MQHRLIVLDPGHFHAALVQKEMYTWLSPEVSVYAPLGRDVVDYLSRIIQFNSRPGQPTSWKVDLLTGPDFLERLKRDRPGDVVVLSGRNRSKIDLIEACVSEGLNVLSDKPWIIRSADLPRLEAILNLAEQKGSIAYDIMTERYEITSILQRELVMDPNIFGSVVEGSADAPAVKARSIHHLMKLVAGVPIRRPAWFFDITEEGEGLADVGTHVVDLVQWTLFSRDIVSCSDIRFENARRWPTRIPLAEFQRVTGEPFPSYLDGHVHDGVLDYYCNNFVHYTVRGIHVALDILWNWEAPAGWGDVGDSYEASFRGTKSTIEIRHEKRPELYVIPEAPGVQTSIERRIQALEPLFPGVAVESSGEEVHIVIPASLRVGHEAHFAQVTNTFVEFLEKGQTPRGWEKANMLVKYFITTKGVEAGHA
jgi:predicted dehydrogenase